EKLHQSLKNLWEKQKAQKRDGVELSYQEEATQEDQYSGNKTSPKKPRDEAQRIIDDWQRKAQDHQLTDREIIQIARKHLGLKAASAFEHRTKVKTDKEAAKLAGISERLFRKYKAMLREVLDSHQSC